MGGVLWFNQATVTAPQPSPKPRGLLARLQNPSTRRGTIVLLVIGGIFIAINCILLVFASVVPPLQTVDSPYAALLEGTWVLAPDSPRPSGYDVQITFHPGRRVSLVDRSTGEGLQASYSFVAEDRVAISIMIGLPTYEFRFTVTEDTLVVEPPAELGWGTITLLRQ